MSKKCNIWWYWPWKLRVGRNVAFFNFASLKLVIYEFIFPIIPNFNFVYKERIIITLKSTVNFFSTSWKFGKFLSRLKCLHYFHKSTCRWYGRKILKHMFSWFLEIMCTFFFFLISFCNEWFIFEKSITEPLKGFIPNHFFF